MLLSLLIPTIEFRRALFHRLHRELTAQILAGGWESEVEILYHSDAGERSIGGKRNDLIERARGRFVAFIDDDDAVSADYVRRVCETIRDNPKIDCLGLRGVITFRGGRPREFIHSLRYGDYFSRNHTYYRPPCHLNPMRREIAARYRFADVSYSEDIDWALRIRRDGALRREAYIDSALYLYSSRRAWNYQWLLDLTEGVRHRFGVRLSNRLAARTAIRSVAGAVLRPWRTTTDGPR
jgi:glycosyltransferase involved in cell wall biosynthesis